MTTILTPYFLDQPIDLHIPAPHTNTPDLPPAAPVMQRLIALYEPLAAHIHHTARHGDLAVSIAGDCVAALPVLAGLQRAAITPTLIWFDAHGDFNDWTTTPSGFLGGMPLAMLSGRGEQTILDGLGLRPLPADNIILTDARDLDPGEREAVAAAPLTHLPDVAMLLDHELPPGPLYIHFDSDILDPADAPAMNYPAPGGPPLAVVRRVLQRLKQSGQVAAVSLSAWAPHLDPHGATRRLVLDLLQELR